MVVRAEHPAMHAFGITQAAECHRLKFGRPRLPSQLQSLLMLAEAAFEATAREEEVPSQEMDARLLGDEPLLDSLCLGPVQIGESAFQVVGDPLHGRQPDPSPALLGATLRRVQRVLVRELGCRYRAGVV